MNSISIIIPVFNEEKNIPLIYKEIVRVWQNLNPLRQLADGGRYNLEIIFVNDGSKDKSGKIIEELSKTDNRVKYIEFSRNFGKEIATSAGLNCAKGDAAILIDADLQHPPGLIPQFLEKWKNGADIVIGVRDKNNGEGFIKKIGSYWFYKLMNAIGGTKIIPRATDYRLISRQVISEFNRFTERGRITRGLIDWLGFNRDFVYFESPARRNGKAGYSCWKLSKLAFSSFVAHSLFPLKLAGYLGVFITIASIILGSVMFIARYILRNYWGMSISGVAQLAVILLFLVGIILSCFGLIALYIASIHGEVLNRPMYVIKSRKL